MANEQLLEKQMHAGYALLAQSLCFILPGSLAYLNLLTSFIVLDLVSTLFWAVVFIGPALLPLALGVALFRGKFAKWALDGWVGFSMCLAFLTFLAYIPMLGHGTPLLFPIVLIVLVIF